MERTAFRTISGAHLIARIAKADDEAVECGYAHEGDILFSRIDAKSDVVASVSPDNLFDNHGNCFSY